MHGKVFGEREHGEFGIEATPQPVPGKIFEGFQSESALATAHGTGGEVLTAEEYVAASQKREEEIRAEEAQAPYLPHVPVVPE